MLLKVLNDSLVLDNVKYCVLAQRFVRARGRTGFLGGMVLGVLGRSVAPTRTPVTALERGWGAKCYWGDPIETNHQEGGGR